MDTIPLPILILVLVFLIILSAFFSGSETSITAINRYKLHHLVQRKHRGALRVMRLIKKMDTLLGSILLGNNFVNILAASITTVIALRLYGDAGIAIATTLLTIVMLIFAEITPKNFATRHPERIAIIASVVLIPFVKLVSPIVFLLNKLISKILTFISGKNHTNNDALSRTEIKSIIKHNPLLSATHSRAVTQMLDLADASVADAMVLKKYIYGINISNSFSSVIRQIRQSAHTYILVYEETLDAVVGFLSLRDIAKHPPENTADLRALLIPPYFIPEHITLLQQLEQFNTRKLHIGCVVDEYGEMIGLITIDNIVATVLGDISENSHSNSNTASLLHKDARGRITVDAAVPITTLNETLHIDLQTDDAKTLNGLLLETLGGFPDGNVCVTVGDIRFETTQLADTAIRTVTIRMPTPHKA